MNMLPLLVIAAAIVVFFQDEFANFFRKLFSYAWVRVFLPLTLASITVWGYKTLYWTLENIQARLHAIMLAFFKLFPYGAWSAVLSQALFLFFLSALPVWGGFWWLTRKSAERIVFKVTCAYLFTWLCIVLLWVV